MMMRMRVILVGLLICLVLVCGCGEKAQEGDTVPVQTACPTEPPVIEGVSQEDLDALGDDLEALEFEDLGGLTDT
jgi:ABC-type metal ion transport system substrate-binding protein